MSTIVANTRFDARRRESISHTPSLDRVAFAFQYQQERRPTAKFAEGQVVQTPVGALPIRYRVYGREGWRYGFEIVEDVPVKIGGKLTGSTMKQRRQVAYMEVEVFPNSPTGEIPDLAAAMAQWIEERLVS